MASELGFSLFPLWAETVGSETHRFACLFPCYFPGKTAGQRLRFQLFPILSPRRVKYFPSPYRERSSQGGGEVSQARKPSIRTAPAEGART